MLETCLSQLQTFRKGSSRRVEKVSPDECFNVFGKVWCVYAVSLWIATSHFFLQNSSTKVGSRINKMNISGISAKINNCMNFGIRMLLYDGKDKSCLI